MTIYLFFGAENGDTEISITFRIESPPFELCVFNSRYRGCCVYFPFGAWVGGLRICWHNCPINFYNSLFSMVVLKMLNMLMLKSRKAGSADQLTAVRKQQLHSLFGFLIADGFSVFFVMHMSFVVQAQPHSSITLEARSKCHLCNIANEA